MAAWEPYDGSSYWDYPRIVQWCHAFVRQHAGWATLQTIGMSREERPIVLLTLGKNPGISPTFWLDGGTHASEWTGVMATLYCLSKWAEEWQTEAGKEWFSNNAICVLPCVSPDGYQALREGAPFLRSSVRPPLDGVYRSGLDPRDINGDGKVLSMRWKHPAGPFVADESKALGLRMRQLGDNPDNAYFLAREGMFMNWDGVKWTQAPSKHGIDLNRNFPVHWLPFQMFGMDGGAYSLSEPESRAVVDAFYQRKRIAAALTNHTYTGAILSQPYHPDSILPESDINLSYHLAKESVRNTDYKAIKVHPDFTYDPKKRIIGVWSDCMTTTFGIPAYTLELWNPFGWAGIEIDNPAKFFRDPDQEVVNTLLEKAASHNFTDWTTFEHPQLGTVEIGGIDYMHTIRNPPDALLPAECEKGFQVANALRHALPKLKLQASTEKLGESHHRLRVLVENLGFLSTTSTQRAKDLGLAKEVLLRVELGEGLTLVDGLVEQRLGRLEGWGDLQVASAKNMVYTSLPGVGHRGEGRWIVAGQGQLTVRWDGGRAGAGRMVVVVGS